MSLTADQILAAEDREIKSIDVPEWGGKVCLRTISGAERDSFEAETFRQDKPNYQNLRARYLALVLCSENGDPLFDKKQVAKLGQKAAPVLDRLFSEAARMNAMSKQDVDELLGESEAARSDDSTSD